VSQPLHPHLHLPTWGYCWSAGQTEAHRSRNTLGKALAKNKLWPIGRMRNFIYIRYIVVPYSSYSFFASSPVNRTVSAAQPSKMSSLTLLISANAAPMSA